MESAINKNSFRFLEPFWPDLHESARMAEEAGAQQPDRAAIRLRGFTEAMVMHLFNRFGLDRVENDTHFDRLVRLEQGDLLDARLLAKFHTIRKLGNEAAHNGRVAPAQAESLLEDAWSLACWFCRFMRPDIEWLTPQRDIKETEAPSSSPVEADATPARQSTATGAPGRILKFPADRILRIQEAVAKAMAQVDPRVRTLRTRIALHDAFSDDLNHDQNGCLAAVSGFLADRDQRVFMLKGYAGTGKTFLIKGITEYLSAQGRAFQLLAPTGRAAKVILEKTGREARTLHSFLYGYGDLQEYRDTPAGSETFKFHAPIRTNSDQANTIYIVDEASLVSDAYAESEFFQSGSGYLLQDFMSYADFANGANDRKIIFVGDPSQLPPVGMSNSPALDSDYLRKHFRLEPAAYELKEIVRQKADSGVIRNVMPLRDSLEKAKFSGLSFDFGEDVCRIRSDDVLPLYMAARTGGGQPIVITYSNAEAAESNRSIRNHLFPDKDFITPGDVLIVTANGHVSDRFLANGEFVHVSGVETAIERRTVTLKDRNPDTGVVEDVEIVLTFRDVEIALPALDEDASTVRVKILDDLLHGRQSGLSGVQQRALYVDFLKRHPDLRRRENRDELSRVLRQDPYFNALRTKFGYAVTCHKAQGGEWTDVFVSCQTGQNPRTADYFRWLYTAMTRASGKLYLVNPPEIRLKVAGADWWSSPAAEAPVAPDTGAVSTPAGGMVSPREAFQSGVLAKIRVILSDTGIVIDDVAHHQYQEAYYLSRGAATCRVNISYNGKFKIGSVMPQQTGPLGEELRALLAPLVGQNWSAPMSAAAGTATGLGAGPALPFLRDLHDRLLPLLEPRSIRVASLEERQWCQRYTFAREGDTAVVDIFYDGRNRFKSCMPVKTSAIPARLVPEVVEILTSEIIL
ncbi:ATP-dependent DNA helicase [Microvirga aerophila]|uniref:Uncharacterized protein n=1 Tax=Microvirga aerophila TaxID=670291 RepID=A0A512BLA8_9HYPH|nr:AAA family ATPase [Microvirga aerophila]GEO12637.1 hypothetical protein MAE02_03330 [Microvirga aerophila]